MYVTNVQDYTTLRQSPDPNAEEVEKLPLDTNVMLLNLSDDEEWAYVMTADELEGYVNTSYMQYTNLGVVD